MPRRKQSVIDAERQEKRNKAESDLEYFIELVHPKRMLGNVHREVIRWWCRPEAKQHQLLLLPRDHMKSALVAYRAAWEITRNPAIKILYISSTSNLAIKQLKFIKDILTNPVYMQFWPEMVYKEEAKREKWTEREMSVDHPKRKEEAVREPTVFTAGLTSNIVGLHCDIAILDDVVVQSNAYTEDGREKVEEQYGALSSVEGVNSSEWTVGTRYHPLDLYSKMMELEVDSYDERGNVSNSQPLYEVFERQVENVGDGTGEFLWPRMRRQDGQWFGFDQEQLAKKRSQYLNKVHFRAQYYNDPHDIDDAPIKRDLFQYYDQNYLSRRDGKWFFKGERLNVVAAVDFAYSTGKRSDATSIVVVGASGSNNYYVLEIDRFKTDAISDYYKRILKLYEKWGFRKIRAEVSVAQAVIVKDLKENYIRPNGLSLSVEEFRPTRWIGSKEERILATLEPKYSNGQMWHYQSGNCQALEEELIFSNPPHDDIKDALASAIDFVTPPTAMFNYNRQTTTSTYEFHSRFGGII